MDYLSRLPEEVVRAIVRRLPYAEMQRVRPSCAALDEACSSLLSTALHELRMRSGCAVQRYLAAAWLRTDHGTQRLRQLYDQRVRLGAASLLVLETMVRVADCGSFILLRNDLLQPLPGELLDEIRKAISIATRRNPLVGRERLRTIYEGLQEYFYQSRIPPTSSIQVVFHTLVELLDCFPAPPWQATPSKDAQSTSVLFHRVIDPAGMFGPRMDITRGDTFLAVNSIITTIIIIFIYNLPNGNVVYDGWNVIDEPCHNFFQITSMSLDVALSDQEAVPVNCLRDLLQLEPKGFSVKLTQNAPNVFRGYSKTVCFNFEKTTQ